MPGARVSAGLRPRNAGSRVCGLSRVAAEKLVLGCPSRSVRSRPPGDQNAARGELPVPRQGILRAAKTSSRFAITARISAWQGRATLTTRWIILRLQSGLPSTSGSGPRGRWSLPTSSFGRWHRSTCSYASLLGGRDSGPGGTSRPSIATAPPTGPTWRAGSVPRSRASRAACTSSPSSPAHPPTAYPRPAGHPSR